MSTVSLEDLQQDGLAMSVARALALANEAAVKVYEALADVRPQSVPDFFRLAAQRMRWLLLDLARRADRSAERRLLW